MYERAGLEERFRWEVSEVSKDGRGSKWWDKKEKKEGEGGGRRRWQIRRKSWQLAGEK